MDKMSLLAALPIHKECRQWIAHTLGGGQVVERHGTIGHAFGLDGRNADAGRDCAAWSRNVGTAD